MEKEAKEDEDKWGEQESGAGAEDNEQMEEEVARILGLPLEDEGEGGELAWPSFAWTPPGVEVPLPAPTLTPTPMPAPLPPLATENNLFPWVPPPPFPCSRVLGVEIRAGVDSVSVEWLGRATSAVLFKFLCGRNGRVHVCRAA